VDALKYDHELRKTKQQYNQIRLRTLYGQWIDWMRQRRRDLYELEDAVFQKFRVPREHQHGRHTYRKSAYFSKLFQGKPMASISDASHVGTFAEEKARLHRSLAKLLLYNKVWFWGSKVPASGEDAQGKRAIEPCMFSFVSLEDCNDVDGKGTPGVKMFFRESSKWLTAKRDRAKEAVEQNIMAPLKNEQAGIDVYMRLRPQREKLQFEIRDWHVMKIQPVEKNVKKETEKSIMTRTFGDPKKLLAKVQKSMDYLPLDLAMETQLLHVYRSQAQAQAKIVDDPSFALEDGCNLQELTLKVMQDAQRIHLGDAGCRTFAQAVKQNVKKYCQYTFTGYPWIKGFHISRMMVLRMKMIAEMVWKQARSDPMRSVGAITKLFAGAKDYFLKVVREFFEIRETFKQILKDNDNTFFLNFLDLWANDCNDTKVIMDMLRLDTKALVFVVMGHSRLAQFFSGKKMVSQKDLEAGDDSRSKGFFASWKSGVLQALVSRNGKKAADEFDVENDPG